MRSLDRARVWATPVLLLLVIILAIALTFKTGLISPSKPNKNSSWLSVAISLVNTVAILVTALLAYFRFFRGRTFARRVLLTASVTILAAPSGDAFHTVVLQANNVGTIPVWDPRVQIDVTELYSAGESRSSALEASYRLAGETSSNRTLINVLDSGETADFVTQKMIDRKVWAVTYLITLRSIAGDAWSTVSAVEGPAGAHGNPGMLSVD